MKTVEKLIKEIRNCPAMYLGKRSAILLNVFIQGWLHGSDKVEDQDILKHFQEWVAKSYGISSSHSWADIITFFEEDEVSAYNTFLKLYDEFIENRANSGALEEKNR